jgi:hypothetical protein
VVDQRVRTWIESLSPSLLRRAADWLQVSLHSKRQRSLSRSARG